MTDYSTCPPHIRDSMERYVEHGIPPGDFLMAFLSNDLMGALGRADYININQFRQIGEWLYNYAPCGCHGSQEIVERWLDKKQAEQKIQRQGLEINAAEEGT